MKIHRVRLPIVLTLLALLLAVVGGGSSDAIAGGLKPLLVNTASGETPPPPAADPDQPQTNKRLRPAADSDGSGGLVIGNGLRGFMGLGSFWTTWYLSRWFAR